MVQDQPLRGLRICFFGHYDPNYPRNRVLRKALVLAGASLVDVNDHALGFNRYLKLFQKGMRCEFDVMIVAPFCHTDMPVARLVCSIKRAPLIFDPLVSLYEGILDRHAMPPGSLMAKKAYWIDRIACQLADIILSDSHATTIYFAETFRLREAKFRRVWVGADDDVLKPSLYDLENPPFTVFFTGSFIPLQGIEYIVRAAKILEQKGEDVQFILTGAGQTLQTIIDLVSDLAVSNVQFKAPMPYEQLSNAMSQAHLCLGIFGTSPKAQHGIPNKIFFAFAAKRPVVTGDTRAMREVFTHGENIWLCPPGDAQVLAKSIVELKHRPELRRKMATNAYEVFVKKFSINAIRADIVAIVRELCETQRAEVVTPVAQASSSK